MLGASAGPALRASAAGAAEGITKASPTTSEATAATSATIIVASFILPLSLSLSVSQSTPCVQIACVRRERSRQRCRQKKKKTGGTISSRIRHRYMRVSTDKTGVPPSANSELRFAHALHRRAWWSMLGHQPASKLVQELSWRR